MFSETDSAGRKIREALRLAYLDGALAELQMRS